MSIFNKNEFITAISMLDKPMIKEIIFISFFMNKYIKYKIASVAINCLLKKRKPNKREKICFSFLLFAIPKEYKITPKKQLTPDSSIIELKNKYLNQ